MGGARQTASLALDLSFYHKTDSLLEKFTRLSQPGRCGQRMRVDNLHDAEDPSFQLRVATFADSHVFGAQAPSKLQKVLLNFGAHGRELISSEVALRLAQMLCGEAPSRFFGSNEKSRARISQLLQQVAIKIVPVQVPSSRKLAELGSASCKQRRLNSRGVDVNRNWNVSWDEGDADTDSNTYRGPRPFSEPETRSLAALAREWSPGVFVDVHSGDRYMAIPFSSRLEGPTNRTERAAMRSALQSVVDMMGKQHEEMLRLDSDLPFGPASSLGEEPYKATGTALDYMYAEVGIPRSFMLEVYGTNTLYGFGDPYQKPIARPPREAMNMLQTAEAEGAGTERRFRSGQPAGQPVAPALLQTSEAAAAPAAMLLTSEAAAGAAAASAAAAAALLPPSQLLLASAPATPVNLTRTNDVNLLQAQDVVDQNVDRLLAGLASEHGGYDCVTFFNPTTQEAFEATINAWADALLVLVNQSTIPLEDAASM